MDHLAPRPAVSDRRKWCRLDLDPASARPPPRPPDALGLGHPPRGQDPASSLQTARQHAACYEEEDADDRYVPREVPGTSGIELRVPAPRINLPKPAPSCGQKEHHPKLGHDVSRVEHGHPCA